MPSNRGVVYLGPGKVEVRNIDFPSFHDPAGKPINHGVILKVVATNICGSDQHMVRGRTTAPVGMVLGHEVTGEIIEVGSDVEYHKIGDLVSVPFNVACGRCRNCREGHTSVCLNVNPERAGGAYGYVDMGGWIGGQAEYFMVPYADFNLLKFIEFSEQGAGSPKDARSDLHNRHSADGVSWRSKCQGRRWLDGVHRRGRTRGSCCGRVCTYSRRGCRADRRLEPGQTRPR